MRGTTLTFLEPACGQWTLLGPLCRQHRVLLGWRIAEEARAAWGERRWNHGRWIKAMEAILDAEENRYADIDQTGG